LKFLTKVQKIEVQGVQPAHVVFVIAIRDVGVMKIDTIEI